MVDKKTWSEFKETGLLLFINNILHVFGWAIVFATDKEGKIIDVYPARVKFRGFDGENSSESHLKIAKWIDANHSELLKEAIGEEENKTLKHESTR